ncbi:helix-turn-helix domain-containing protein [Leifsonia sp. NCR5]|uniref:helix-turn-helix domain-containing protein n=1 Tax=Leifsonia sp. NCR5 TaxID=1978342 RepID=UPI000A198210|nr:helix-turn-helix transcriptional regulator [Leifsonia sp. NCR5]
MADFRTENGIGARIKLARRERGFRSTRELADAIPGGNITQAVLENIESGRKADISVTQLLNIARGLNVPVSMLLAPIGAPESNLDLPNLSDDFAEMTAAEFDCWLSATPLSSYQPRLASERSDIATLNTLRELGTLRREIDRVRLVRDVRKSSGDADLAIDTDLESRLELVEREAARLAALLTSSGIAASGAP